MLCAGLAHGFRDSGGNYTTLDYPSGIADSQTYPEGINDAGQIVGSYTSVIDNVSAHYGFLYRAGTYITLADPSAPQFTSAIGINNAGQVVGAYAINYQTYGFLYSGGTYTTIDDPAAATSLAGTVASGINDAGQIVGYYIDSAGIGHGFLYSGDGTYTTIDDPLGTKGTEAEGINDEGQIAGVYVDGSNKSHMFIYSEGSYITINDPPGAIGATVTGINNNGQISGYYYDASGFHGFIGTPTATEPLTLTGTVAHQAINDNATIDPFARVTVTDPNFNQTETVHVTLSNAANGALFDPHAANDGSTIMNGVYTVTGTAAAVTANLDALVFIPTQHQVKPGGSVTTGFAIAVTDTAGQTASDSTTSVVATAVAVAVAVPPTISGTVANQFAFPFQPIHPFAQVVIGDANLGQTETLVVTLGATAHGFLLDPNAHTDGSQYSSGVYTVNGSAAAVTADLRGLLFEPTFAETDFTIKVTDTASATATDHTTTVVGSLFPISSLTLSRSDASLFFLTRSLILIRLRDRDVGAVIGIRRHPAHDQLGLGGLADIHLDRLPRFAEGGFPQPLASL